MVSQFIQRENHTPWWPTHPSMLSSSPQLSLLWFSHLCLPLLLCFSSLASLLFLETKTSGVPSKSQYLLSPLQTELFSQLCTWFVPSHYSDIYSNISYSERFSMNKIKILNQISSEIALYPPDSTHCWLILCFVSCFSTALLIYLVICFSPLKRQLTKSKCFVSLIQFHFL